MKVLLGAALVFSLVGFTGSSHANVSAAIQSCSAKNDNFERLSCFDTLSAKVATESAIDPASPTGVVWSYLNTG